MSSTGTRPPLFEPEPGDGSAPRYPRQRSGGESAYPRTRGGSAGSSPAWVRPFILGGLVLIALVSLISIFGLGGGDDPDATGGAVADEDAEGDQRADADDAPAGEAASQQAAAIGDPRDPEDTAVDQAEASPAGDVVGRITAAEAFAVQFAHDYLNIDGRQPESVEARERNLRAYLAPGLDPQLGWDGQGYQIAVLTTPIALRTEGEHTVVTVASNVTGDGAPRWVHLDVSMARDEAGRWAVVAPPAFVPRPPAGTPALPPAPEVDADLSAELRPVVEELFRAYATDSTVRVEDVTSDAGSIRGLGGQVQFEELDQLQVLTGEGDARQAVAEVTWSDSIAEARYTQRYVVQLVRTAGVWLVDAVTVTPR